MERADVKKVFMERFDKLRGERNNTNFGLFLGLSRQTVGFYLNGDRTPDAPNLAKIARKCGVTTDYLLGLKDVASTDDSVASACETTGLSQKAVERLKSLDREQIVALSSILESFDQFLIIGGTK